MSRKGEFVSFLHKIISLTFVLLWLAACSDDTSSGEVVVRIDENGNTFSPVYLQGTIEYLPLMESEMVRVVRLDDKLNPIDSIEIPTEKTYGADIFVSEVLELEYPYLKIVTVFEAEDKKKMEFAQYVHLSGNNARLKQNIFAALAAGRIETLVKEKKKNYDDAEADALAELGEAFNLDLSNINSESFQSLTMVFNDLKDQAPYVYCRHEISDSVFYHDFEELRDDFAKTGKIKSSVIVRAADAWLSTFEQVLDEGTDRFYRSKTRDTLVNLSSMNYPFFEKAYGIEFDRSAGDSFDPIEITEKSSAYYKRVFVMDNSWRLKSLLEDKIGLCLYKEKKIVSYEGQNYLCTQESNVWRKESNADTLLAYSFGKCTWSCANRLEYIGDSLYACRCTGDYVYGNNSSCAWEKTWGNENFTPDDPLYEMVLNDEAIRRFGVCVREDLLDGERKRIDDVFVECSGSWWTPIDSLTYYLGDCYYSHKEELGEHLGKYYQCLEGGSSYVWTEVVPPVYFGDTCTNFDDGKVVEYDKSYYICESDACKDADPEDVCWGFGTWRKLDSLEVIRFKED